MEASATPPTTTTTTRNRFNPLTDPRTALESTLFSSWYPRFKRISPKATILDLNRIQPDFLDWLEEDGIVLPSSSSSLPKFSSPQDEEDRLSQSSDDDDDDNEGRDFTNLDQKINEVIRTYQGPVFPKLNWSSPQDASWILAGSSLKCVEPQDIYLALKSSDFVTNDLEQARELTSSSVGLDDGGEGEVAEPGEVLIKVQTTRVPTRNPSSESKGSNQTPPPPHLELVLKKWFDMPKSHEFRCFVRDDSLISLSQRDITFFEHLQPREVRDEIRSKLQRFFSDHLGGGRVGIKDYIFDAYLTRDRSKVFLVDINPFLPRTDTILWGWQELEDLAVREDSASLPPLRLIESNAQATQSFPTYSSNMVPKDVIDVSNGQGIAEFAKNWAQEVSKAAFDPREEDEE
ncbi:D123-domain-containing protein [Violaceomyces palustris]|uniref:D123-domain-containing protein n=1 Tax=Violaceomyces palustris TaxID=1673888 RepID=A0ACD0NY86_9BASI|nr:D123-domain-containing protein [Violaceomyces palustris]